jgi:hypothetical protein
MTLRGPRRVDVPRYASRLAHYSRGRLGLAEEVKADGAPRRSMQNVRYRRALKGRVVLPVHKDAIVVTGTAMNTRTDIECEERPASEDE